MSKKNQQLTLDALYIGVANVRKEVGILNGLIESIKSQGIINPLTVRKGKDGKYEVIAGRRRLEAAKIANLTDVPVIIQEADDVEAKAISLRENWDRGNLSIEEEGEAFRYLEDQLGTIAKVADYLNKPQQYIRGALDSIAFRERTGITVKETQKYTPRETGEVSKDVAVKVRRVMRSRDVESKLRKESAERVNTIERELGLTLQKETEKNRPKILAKFKKNPLKAIDDIVEEAKKEPESIITTIYFGTDVSPFVLAECEKGGLVPSKWVQSIIRHYLINAGYKIATVGQTSLA